MYACVECAGGAPEGSRNGIRERLTLVSITRNEWFKIYMKMADENCNTTTETTNGKKQLICVKCDKVIKQLVICGTCDASLHAYCARLHIIVSHPVDDNNCSEPVEDVDENVDNLPINDELEVIEIEEMSAMPTKTPVSVLQELLSRRGITPKYELVQIEGAIHEPIFRYRVYLSNDYIATGTGRSKKEAKHAAAKNLLELLVGKQTAEQANAANGTPGAADITNEVVSPFDDKVMGNPIGWLQEMCMSRRWPPPSYEMEHEEGLPHERQFSIACQVLKFREVGNGKSKKMAKRMAAHKMWQALQDMPLDGGNAGSQQTDATLAIECEWMTPLNTIQSRYATLKDSKMNSLMSNSAQKIAQFQKNLLKVTGSKVTELQNTALNTKDFNYIQFLQEVMTEQLLEVTYVDIEEKSLTGQNQCLVQMSTVPIAVCHGTGATAKEAQSAAARNALEYLKLMTRK